jgi:hypothetical protein
MKSTSDDIVETKYARVVRQTLPIVILGTVAWFVTLVIEIAVRATNTSIWIALVGIGLGFLGTAYIILGLRRKRQAQQ